MHLLIDWIHHAWDLLQTIGWWSVLGLVICGLLRVLLPEKLWKQRGYGALFWAVAGGAALPMCNFGAIPLAIGILKCGAGIDCVLAFLSAATLLSPAGILFARAYMGPVLAAAYAVAALSTAFLTGLFARRFLRAEEAEWQVERCSLTDGFWRNLAAFSSELAFWLVVGILLEAVLLVFSSEVIKQEVLMNPSNISAIEAVSLGVFRHVCTPDDVSMVASLVAAGMMPGGALLFLLFGIGTNMPELTALYGMAGKRAMLIYSGTMTLCGLAAFAVVQTMIAPGFVPQFSLEHAETWTTLANWLSIRTWMPARLPCAVLLLILCGYGVRNQK